MSIYGSECVPFISFSLSRFKLSELQANVMLSYKLPEAIELLRSKQDMAEKNLTTVVDDLEYLKEQVTIMEVNIARVYNWDVKRRREKRDKEEGSKS